MLLCFDLVGFGLLCCVGVSVVLHCVLVLCCVVLCVVVLGVVVVVVVVLCL